MASVQGLLDRSAKLLVHFGSVLLVLMAVHIVLDVLGRYVFNAPLPGTVECVSHYYMVGVIFAPLAFVQSRHGHFFTAVLAQSLPARVQRALEAACLMVTAVLLLGLTWRTTAYALELTRAGECVQTAYFAIPTWPSRWIVPAGLGLMALYALLQTAQLVIERPRRGAAA